ncbi:flagellar biosynthesis protein FlgA [Acuticoccus sp.]|uniref:flagellar biosynthesis protein FlgA n=1 Tax=Acuticoccus sp. TaxID=1904378 RepID=UPI003B52297C
MDLAFLLARSGPDAPTTAALIGVGEFGRTLLMQSRSIAMLRLGVLCDLDVERVLRLCTSAGIDAVAADGRTRAEAAMQAGRVVVTADAELAVSLPVDVVVEATGSAQAGAQNTSAALDQGRHVCLVTKEADCVVGPLLSRRAKAAGLVLSQVDGDQPSLLLALLSRLRVLGFEVACAGKASEHDFVFDGASVRSHGAEVTAPRDIMGGADRGSAELVAWRAEVLGALPQRTAPDYCELALVANASGLVPDRPRLHAAVARLGELPSLYRPVDEGGVLAGNGRLDIFNGLRRDDEVSPAGGVFVVVKAPDPETGQLFRAKGIPTSADGGHVLVFNPVHLLGAEAPLSILLPHRLGISTGAQGSSATVDVTMRASRRLGASERLTDLGHHHRVDGVEAMLTPYAALRPDAPVPYFLAIDRPLVRDVAEGATITVADVNLDEGSTLLSLRREQDALTDAQEEDLR